MLATHEEGNHHVRNLFVGNWRSILVGRVHEVPNHVLFGFDIARLCSAFIDDVHVYFAHLDMSGVATAVPGQGQSGKEEVDGREALFNTC